MAVKTFATGEILTATDTNTYLANSGLVFVKQVTVGSTVSSVNVTSCFSSTYDNYRIVFSNITSSLTSQDLWLQLLSGTTPAQTTYYGSTLYITFVTPTATAIAQNNDTYFRVGSVNDATFRHGGVLDCLMPNLAVPTLFQSTAYLSRTDISAMAHTGNHRVSTAYDGFRLLPSSGTITGGRITVYGYRLE